QAEDGIRYRNVTGVQTCALPISAESTSVRLPTSAVAVAISIPYVFNSFVTFFNPSSFRAFSLRCTPSFARAVAVARPIPLLDPVILAVFPVTYSFTSFSSSTYSVLILFLFFFDFYIFCWDCCLFCSSHTFVCICCVCCVPC